MELLTAMAAGLARAAGPVIALFVRKAKQLKAERDAAQGDYPDANSRRETERQVDAVLARLGGPSDGAPWWQQAVTSVQGAAVRSEELKKPHVQDWLNRARTKELLKQHAIALHFGKTPNGQIHQELAESLSNIGGDHPGIAATTVDLVLGVLRTALSAGATDALTLEAVQESAQTQERHFTQLTGSIEQLGSKVAPASVPELSDAAARDLDKIVRLRSCPRRQPVTELGELWERLSPGGRYQLADDNVRREVLTWLVRITAANRDLAAAQHWEERLIALGGVLSETLKALVLFSRGDELAALQTIRQVDTADGRANLLFLMARSNGDKQALEYFRKLAPLPTEFFTGHGWRTYLALAISDGRFNEAEEQLIRLPSEFFHACVGLRLIAGALHASALVSTEKRHAVIELGPLALTDEVLDGPEAARARREAIRQFELARTECAALGAARTERICSVWVSALRLLDSELRPAEIESMRQRMADVKEAVSLAQIAYRFNVPVDSTSLRSHLAMHRLAGGLTDEESIAEFELNRAALPAEEYLAYLQAQADVIARITSEQMLAVELISTHCRLKDVGRARETLAKYAERLGEDARRAEIMIDRAAGEDPSSRALQLYQNTRSLVDLANAVQSLELAKRWTDLMPLSAELYVRQPNAASAMTHANAMQKAGTAPRDLLSAGQQTHLRVIAGLRFEVPRTCLRGRRAARALCAAGR